MMKSDEAATPSWIAKDCLDVGIFTNELEDQLHFWQQDIGLDFDHMLPVGGGVRQHRHDFLGSVFKLNNARDPLPARTDAGYMKLLIAKDDLAEPKSLRDPDGNEIELVPAGYQGIDQWAITVSCGSEKEFKDFYVDALGLPAEPRQQCAVRCGRSLIIGHVDPVLADRTDSEIMQRKGFRYITLQVDKVDAVHAQVLAGGGKEGRAPTTLGKTARISFVRDGRGNWIELSQRASITGSLEQ